MNIKSKSRYRSYGDFVPNYLRDRPKELVKHCMDQIFIAENIASDGIIMTEQGSFLVPSESMGTDNRHEVYFGDEMTLPSCTCYAWQRSVYLCKHFFLVFKRFPAWSWFALCSKYRDSPYMTVDPLFENSHSQNIMQEKTEASASDEIGPCAVERKDE